MDPNEQGKNQPYSHPSSRPSDAAGFHFNYGSIANETTSPVTISEVREARYENNGLQSPYYYYYPLERGQAPRFGLIRGYHRQMYEPVSQRRTCCECAIGDAKRGTTEARCNWGVAFGCVLLIIGIIAILMGFMVPQKSSTRYEHLSPEDRRELNQINLFIDVFVISGLSVLSIGGVLISGALLIPLFRRKADSSYDETTRYFGSEVYVKSEDLSMNKSGDASINWGFHKDVVPADFTLRKIQPEREKSEPVDLTTTVKWL